MPAKKTVQRKPAAAAPKLRKCMSVEDFKRLTEDELDQALQKLRMDVEGEEEEEEEEDAEDTTAEEARPSGDARDADAGRTGEAADAGGTAE